MAQNRKERALGMGCRIQACAGVRTAIIAFVALLAWTAAAQAQKPLGTLKEIHRLSNAEAAHHLPVAFEATVTYFRGYERTLFVQDDDVAIYIQPSTVYNLLPGDRILIRGTTEPSFRPFVKDAIIKVLSHGAVPKAVPATFDELIRTEHDCMFVSVRAKVLAADSVNSSGVRSTSLQLSTGGGVVDAIIDGDDPSRLQGLLDADVEISGAAAGRFDGKMEETGIEIHASSFDDMKVLKFADVSPLSLPITPMDRILDSYHVQLQSQRIRVHGTITYYQPGSAIVLQDGAKSLWIETRSVDPVQVGDLADATGFAGLHDGFLTLTDGAIADTYTRAPVTPVPASWHRLAGSKNVFDLVSIEGKIQGEVAEAAQDEYVLEADGQMFSAIYRHSSAAPGRAAAQPLKQIPIGSAIRVSGICMMDDSNPFNTQVPFTILMRSPDDVVVVAEPSWLNIANLMRIVSLLSFVMLAAICWVAILNRKVRRQTTALSKRIEAEAVLERRMAQLEQRRSSILEDINGSKPLAEILEAITELVSFRLDGAQCWCEITDGARLGHPPMAPDSLRIVSELIPARSGASLGALSAGFAPMSVPGDAEVAALGVGARLATLAIETRRLYTDLRHRSEFDLLTDIHNRFSLEKHIDTLIEDARQRAGIFGLIYVDLDEFKQVNDIYGHRVGDLYLQEVATRMKCQLRGHDMLARLGGDEFAAVVSIVRNRAIVEEVAQRLEKCFEEPFEVEGYTLRGAASIGLAIYPEDGTTRDSLISASDAAMYVAKHTKHSPRSRAERESTGFIPKDRA